MVGYKLSKNDWVTPLFVIFRSVREILLVTVFFEHPVFDNSRKMRRMVFQNLSQSGLLLLPDLVNTLVRYFAGLNGERDLKN